jgi:hypothetical protein
MRPENPRYSHQTEDGKEMGITRLLTFTEQARFWH